MTLKSLFKKRKTLYYKELLKYFRYIFNDHFSIVLFFIIGSGGYAYSNYLEEISYGNVQPILLLVFVYFFISITGSVTLVVEKADQLFLLPKEEDFYPILKNAVVKSYVQSLIPLSLVSFITFPVFALTKEATIVEGFLLFFILASLKWLNLLMKIYPYFFQNNKEYQKYKGILYFVTFLAIFSMSFVTIAGTAVITIILAMISMYLFFKEKVYFDHSLKWSAIIEAEEARLHKLYRFIQIFMDVPHMDTNIRRLSGLDKLLEWFSASYPKAPYYYLLRMIVRNTEYSLLVLRLTIIGSLLLFLMDSYLLSVIFLLLFIYILGFQLISLVKDIERVPQFQTYPITKKVKIDSSLYLINQLLLFMTIFLTVSSTINLGAIGITFLPIGIFASYVFSYFYVPFRLKE